jgi:hypothetical protein
MIKKFDANDIARILSLDHDIDDHLPFAAGHTTIRTRGEWVQYLMEAKDHPDFFIVGDIEQKINGYLVAFLNPTPLVWVVYSWTAGLDANKKVLEMLKEWGREKGAKSIDFITDNVAGHTVYGFRKKATLMTMEL